MRIGLLPYPEALWAMNILIRISYVLSAGYTRLRAAGMTLPGWRRWLRPAHLQGRRETGGWRLSGNAPHPGIKSVAARLTAPIFAVHLTDLLTRRSFLSWNGAVYCHRKACSCLYNVRFIETGFGDQCRLSGAAFVCSLFLLGIS